MENSAEAKLNGQGVSWAKCISAVVAGVAFYYASGWVLWRIDGFYPPPYLWPLVRFLPTSMMAEAVAHTRHAGMAGGAVQFLYLGVLGLVFGGLWGGLVAGRRWMLRSAAGGLLAGLVSVPLGFAAVAFMNRIAMPAGATEAVATSWEIGCVTLIGAVVGGLWGLVAGGSRFGVKALVAGAVGAFAGDAMIALAEWFAVNSSASAGASGHLVDRNAVWILFVACLVGSWVLRRLPAWKIGSGRRGQADALARPPLTPHL